MKIYLSHSSSFSYRDEFYAPLQEAPSLAEFQLVMPHQTSSDPYPTKELFESEECSLVVAELSFPSTGQGIELAWAVSMNIPIFGLLRTNASTSAALAALSIQPHTYASQKQMVQLVVEYIAHSL